MSKHTRSVHYKKAAAVHYAGEKARTKGGAKPNEGYAGTIADSYDMPSLGDPKLCITYGSITTCCRFARQFFTDKPAEQMTECSTKFGADF